MDSDVEQVQQPRGKNSFFQGLSQAPKLTQKVKLLRNNIQENSQLQTKTSTLQNKIAKRAQNAPVSQQQSAIFEEKIIVQEDVNKHNKKKQNPNLLTPQPHMKQKGFEDMRIIRPILKAVNELNYVRPTPIQQLAIPVISSGKDVVASSITGSGKTAAFLIPLIQRYFNVPPVGYIRSLILTPTRELAIQIFQQFQKLNKYARLQAVLVIGASSLQKQQASLRNNPQVVICTPGRVVDLLMNSRSIGIEDLQMLILDQADKLLELGFENQIKQILRYCNPQVQTVLFSATLGTSIDRLATIATRKPVRLSADPDNKTAQLLHQQVLKLRDESQQYREAALVTVLKDLYKERVIIFFKTKKQCHRMAIILGLIGLSALELHGNLSQTQRIQAFLDFKEEKCNYLLATDLAARGLDIRDVQTVINFELPTHLTKYIHRVGRTARAGSGGTSLTFCNQQECLQLKKMARKTGDKLYKLNVSESAVKKMQTTIQGLYQEIGVILTQQREEMSLRRADMQLKKLENITEHNQQIYSRPRRQWFLSKKQKRDIQEQARQQTGQKAQVIQKTKIIKKKEKHFKKR